jgi:hypothetical protein
MNDYVYLFNVTQYEVTFFLNMHLLEAAVPGVSQSQRYVAQPLRVPRSPASRPGYAQFGTHNVLIASTRGGQVQFQVTIEPERARTGDVQLYVAADATLLVFPDGSTEVTSAEAATDEQVALVKSGG